MLFEHRTVTPRVRSALQDCEQAIARLTEQLGVQPSEVLAIGDELNDIEMIRWAGYGVAMGNALPQVKAAADAVTAPNSADGLAVVLEALLAVRELTAS